MAQHSPCEYYLKYLITHPDGYEDIYIQDLIRLQGLDFIGMPYMQRLRAACRAPIPFYPERKDHARSRRFLKKEKIYSIYHPDDDMAAATALLDKPRAKEIIEGMLIAYSTPEWVSMALKHQGISATPEAIEHYVHYYFNLELVDRDDLMALLDLRFISETADRTEQNYNILRASTSKWGGRKRLASIVVPNVANMMATMRLGVLPSNAEVSRLASATRIAAINMAYDSIHQGSPDRGQGFANVAESMHRIMQEIGDADDSLQEGLARMQLETDNQPVPHIKQLSEGSTRTLDLQPIEEGEKANAK